MIAVLCDRHVCYHAGIRLPPRDRQRWHRRLHHGLALLHDMAGRTCRTTSKRPGVYLSTSVTSALTLRRAPSQPGVGHACGSCTTVVRGSFSGNLRRGFLLFSGALSVVVSVAGAAASALASASALAASSSSSLNSSCTISRS